MKQTTIVQTLADLKKALPAHETGEIWTIRIAPKVLVEIAQSEMYRGQRNHEKDAPKKKFLHKELFGDQRIASAARYKVGRKFHIPLIDGYNRQEVMNILNYANAPKYFTLIVHDVQQEQDVKVLYKQIDNSAAAKKGRALLQEAIRLAFGNPNKFQSDLLAEGSILWGLRQINSDVYAAVESHKEGLLLIDSLGLTRNMQRISSSVIGAIVSIAQIAQENNALLGLSMDFIRAILHTEFVALGIPGSRMSENIILRIRQNFNERKCAGRLSGGNAKTFYNELMNGFAQFIVAKQTEYGIKTTVSIHENAPVQELIRTLKLAA